MILDLIRMENFGAYGGKQEAILTPEANKPVVLFGGMNGGGKTTLLDALQLALYGSKAKVSNRGRLGYRDYLRDCIHRGVDPKTGASIALRFRRMIEGKTTHFEVQRSWREGAKGIEETLIILRDEKPDEIFTEHWDEVIEAYLPVSISNLFFFDGEQIKELAEGSNAAAILGTAIRSLLGLDLVDRLEGDLKVFERKKKAAALDPEAARQLAIAEAELEQIEQQLTAHAQKSGSLKNESEQLEKDVQRKSEKFRTEGGDLFLKRKEMETELDNLKSQKSKKEALLRELASGSLPLLLISNLLEQVENQAKNETEIRHNRLLVEVMEERDGNLLGILRNEKIASAAINRVDRELKIDREYRRGLAEQDLILDADDHLAPHISHLRGKVLPEAAETMNDDVSAIRRLEEKISRLESELGRVPEEDRIAAFQESLEKARIAHTEKVAEFDGLKIRQGVLQRQREEVSNRIERFGEQDQGVRLAEDDRLRMLKHSKKVRQTLELFRTKVIQRHVTNMEALMLESFQKLLRKADLIRGLSIDPESFEVTLKGKDGKTLPFDRLSAGERQLLATAMLWGLARASGRPIPTVIDTPLGRLDSSHRKHLIDRYFPSASHQVLLLSTDEEIVDSYHTALKPSVVRHYLLAHDEALGLTKVEPGYFDSHELTH